MDSNLDLFNIRSSAKLYNDNDLVKQRQIFHWKELIVDQTKTTQFPSTIFLYIVEFLCWNLRWLLQLYVLEFTFVPTNF